MTSLLICIGQPCLASHPPSSKCQIPIVTLPVLLPVGPGNTNVNIKMCIFPKTAVDFEMNLPVCA